MILKVSIGSSPIKYSIKVDNPNAMTKANMGASKVVNFNDNFMI